MSNWILFAISLAWIGIGAAASIYSDESRITRLLGVITIKTCPSSFIFYDFFLDLLDLPEDKTTFISPASALTPQTCCDRNTITSSTQPAYEYFMQTEDSVPWRHCPNVFVGHKKERRHTE